MQTRVKTPDEIKRIRESGRMLAAIHQQIRQFVKAGTTGLDVSALCKRELKAFGATAPFLGFEGYPDVICISVNDEVVHGIPNDIQFQSGDLVTFDFGVTWQGMVTDSAFSMFVGGKAPNKQAQQLLDTTNASLDAGIAAVKDGIKTGDIGAAVQAAVGKKFGIVRELVGHGVGHELHEGPDIPNYGKAGTGATLKAGMTIAIEPMITLGDYRVLVDADGWTIRTRDGSLAAHAEHTVLITETGAEVLTSL